jgi:hypothetical protein
VKQAMMRQALLMAGVVLVVGGVLAAIFKGPGDLRAIGMSGVVAVVVQCAAFSLSRMVGAGNLSARLGMGALLRFLAVGIYAVLVVLVLKLPATAALISLATFFFVSTVIEPLLIK